MLLMVFCASALAFSICLMLLRLLLSDRLSVTKRLNSLSGIAKSAERACREKHPGKIKLPSIKFFSSLTLELSSAGIALRPEEFMMAWIIAAVIPACVIAMASGSAVTAAGLATIGLAAPPFIVRRKRAKRIQKFEKQLGEVLMVACNCLRSGLTFTQAMESIATETEEPMSSEFSRTLREMSLGSSFERAMENLSKRVPSGDLMLLVSAVLIQRQVGGNLSEILESLSVTIRERLKLKDDIRVLTATGRMSGTVIGCLPIGIALILMLINPGYIESFFSSQSGINMLIVAGVMEVAGFLLVRRIVNIKF